jgi:hypothetical protein
MLNLPHLCPANMPDSEPQELARKLATEFVGTGPLVMIVVASGIISAESLTDDAVSNS